jgi:molybdenum cofactor cytidylyltransferase
MPYIRPQTIVKIAATLAAGAAIVAPVYHGERGHPVGLSSQFRGQLEALRGDEGSRSILRRNEGSVTLIDVDDPGVCRDIDTPADL